MKLSFRFAEPEEYPQISAFLDQHWASNHVYCRNKPLFDWTFGPRTYWDHAGYCFVMAEDGAQLAGILGGIPFWFNALGERKRGVWIANWVMSPDHRRGTSGLQLLNMFRKDPFEVTVASGISDATTPIYKILRGEVLPEIPRHFLVLPGQTARMEALLEVAQPEWSAGQRRSLAGAFEMKREPATVAAGSTLPSAWDKTDWPEIANHTIGASRDCEYLSWRYLQHPDFEYQFLTVSEGERTGLAVWRLETVRKAAESGERVDIDKLGRLVEFLPASPDNAEALFQAFLGRLKECGAMGADYYGFHGPTRVLLETMGFQLATEHPEGGSLPTRFQPLDGKGGGILSAMFAPEGLPACDGSAECPWYWTKSDSDQDRPN